MDRCQICRFWEESEYSKRNCVLDRRSGVVGHHTDGSASNCRRRAPVGRGEHYAIWPVTKKGDWCGEFEAVVKEIEGK
jgi:hypothetical protein